MVTRELRIFAKSALQQYFEIELPQHASSEKRIDVTTRFATNSNQEMAWKQTLAEARWYKSQNWNRTKQPPFALLQFPPAA